MGAVDEGLARRHAEGAIEPDGFAVEHRVRYDGERELGIFFGAAETAGEWDRGAELLLHLRGQGGEQRRIEQAGGDGDDADAGFGEFAGERESEAGDACLR